MTRWPRWTVKRQLQITFFVHRTRPDRSSVSNDSPCTDLETKSVSNSAMYSEFPQKPMNRAIRRRYHVRRMRRLERRWKMRGINIRFVYYRHKHDSMRFGVWGSPSSTYRRLWRQETRAFHKRQFEQLDDPDLFQQFSHNKG